jgi:hypothetical protein
MRAEVVQDGPAVVQQGLDVDQLQGPDPVPEDPVAGREAFGAGEPGLPGGFQVVGPAARSTRAGLRPVRGAVPSVAATGRRTSPSSVPRRERTTTVWPRS